MAISSSSENRGNCHIFGLWLSQWRLAVLDGESAKSLLLLVLDSMRVMRDQEIFWTHLQRFFDLQIQDSDADESNSISNLYDQLRLRASLLTPFEAKLLLEHLSRSSSLNEDRVFWQIVETVINQCESRENGETRCDSITQ